MTLPFRTVKTITGETTHLGLSTPLVPGHAPGKLPAWTLCGHLAGSESTTPIGEITCRRCLFAAPRYMTWPAFKDCP